MEYLVKHVFQIEKDQIALIEGILGSLIPIGALFGAIIVPILLNKFTRRTTIILCDIAGIIGSLFACFINLYTFMIHRFIAGVIVGANSLIGPLYVRECSPVIMYGQMGFVKTFFSYFATAVAYIIGYFTVQYFWQAPFLSNLYEFIKFLISNNINSKLFSYSVTPIPPPPTSYYAVPLPLFSYYSIFIILQSSFSTFHLPSCLMYTVTYDFFKPYMHILHFDFPFCFINV